MIIKFFQQSLKIQYKLALLPPSKYTKTLIFKNLGIHMKQFGLLRSLCSEQGQNLRKLWRVPQCFFKRGIPCQRKFEWNARFL